MTCPTESSCDPLCDHLVITLDIQMRARIGLEERERFLPQPLIIRVSLTTRPTVRLNYHTLRTTIRAIVSAKSWIWLEDLGQALRESFRQPDILAGTIGLTKPYALDRLDRAEVHYRFIHDSMHPDCTPTA